MPFSLTTLAGPSTLIAVLITFLIVLMSCEYFLQWHLVLLSPFRGLRSSHTCSWGISVYLQPFTSRRCRAPYQRTVFCTSSALRRWASSQPSSQDGRPLWTPSASQRSFAGLGVTMWYGLLPGALCGSFKFSSSESALSTSFKRNDVAAVAAPWLSHLDRQRRVWLHCSSGCADVRLSPLLQSAG